MGTIRRKTKTIYFDVRDDLSEQALTTVAEYLIRRSVSTIVNQSSTNYPAWNKIAKADADIVIEFELKQNSSNKAKIRVNRIKKDTTGKVERNTKKSRELAEVLKHYFLSADLSLSSEQARNIPYEETKRMRWFVDSDVPYLTITVNCEKDFTDDVMSAFAEGILDYLGR